MANRRLWLVVVLERRQRLAPGTIAFDENRDLDQVQRNLSGNGIPDGDE